jgi:hypothetical protein
MNEINDYEPVITILSYPVQQIRIKDIQGIGTGPDPDRQVAAISPKLPPVYPVEILGEKKTCTFLTQSIQDRDNSIAQINRAMQAKESLDVHPDPVVNRVK